LNLLPDITRISEGEDHRYFPRWKIDRRAQYHLMQRLSEKEARAVDLSCTGTCIVTQDPLLPTQKLEMNLFLNDATALTVRGRVVWVKHFPKLNEAGILFDAIDQKTQDRILDHAFNLNKDDLVNYWFKGWNENGPRH